MSGQLAVALVALLFLNFKHFLCDFPLQSDYQLRTKGVYGHSGGLAHSAMHALATTPVFILLGSPFGLALAIVAAEFVVHYHIDWVKEKIQRSANWRSGDRGYWNTFGLDQMLHNFTYVGIVAVAT